MTALADPLYNSSAKALARAIREKRISSLELVDLYLARIEEVNPALNAVVQIRAEGARADARRADASLARGESLGPLHGLPMTIKDSFDTAGLVTSWGTLGRVGFVPDQDATIVRRLKDAGAILLGKTNTPEFTMGGETQNLVYGRTNHPWDLSRSPAGSSGGSAAIVAAGGAAFDVGTDATGSVRGPAAVCGLAGLKPTQSRIPRTGHAIPFGGISDLYPQPGPLARYVEDLYMLLVILSGPDHVDPSILPMPLGDPEDVQLSSLRVAFYVDDGVGTPTPATQEAVRAAASALEGAVLQVVEARPSGIERTATVSEALIFADGGAMFRRLISAQGTTELSIDPAWSSPADFVFPTLDGEELDAVIAAWYALRSEMSSFLLEHDVVVCPVLGYPAWFHGAEPTFGGSYMEAYSLLGWPVATVRCGTSPEDLPIGVQIAGAPGREDIVLAVAAHLESILGGFRPPPI